MRPEETDRLRIQLIERVINLPASQLAAVAAFLQLNIDSEDLISPAPAVPEATSVWPHAPLHRLSEHGTFIVTAGTYEKEHLFRGPERLAHLQTELLTLAQEMGWSMEAWAVFSNHYHFIAHAGPAAHDLGDLLHTLHGRTARQVNLLDVVEGRQVWFNFWETRLTYERSYLARLHYVHENPVRH